MRVTVNVSNEVGEKIQQLPDDFEMCSSPALNHAVERYHAIQDFINDTISLTDLTQIFHLDHIDMIVWLKKNGINPPSIQGYSKNGFTQEFEKELDKVTEEAEKGIGLSKGFDNVEEFLEDLNKEADQYRDSEL